MSHLRRVASCLASASTRLATEEEEEVKEEEEADKLVLFFLHFACWVLLQNEFALLTRASYLN